MNRVPPDADTSPPVPRSAANKAAVLVGVLFSLLSIAGALGHQIAASALARAPARRVIATAIVVAAAGLALLPVSSAVWPLMAGILAVGVGVGVAMTAAFTAAGASIPRHVHSTSFGFLTGASLTGTATGPVLGGLVATVGDTVIDGTVRTRLDQLKSRL